MFHLISLHGARLMYVKLRFLQTVPSQGHKPSDLEELYVRPGVGPAPGPGSVGSHRGKMTQKNTLEMVSHAYFH